MNKIDQHTVAEINSMLSHGLKSITKGEKGVKGSMCMQSLISHVLGEEIFSDMPECVANNLLDFSVWVNDSLYSTYTVSNYLKDKSLPFKEEKDICIVRANELREYSIAQLGSSDVGDDLFYNNMLMMSTYCAFIELFKSHPDLFCCYSNSKYINMYELFALNDFSEFSKGESFCEQVNSRGREIGIILNHIYDNNKLSDLFPSLNRLEKSIFDLHASIYDDLDSKNYYLQRSKYVSVISLSNSLCIFDSKELIKCKMSLRRDFLSRVVKGLELAGTEGSKYLYLVREGRS